MPDNPVSTGTTVSVWHEGERKLQTFAGTRERLEQRGHVVIRDHMPDQHREFFAERNQMFLSTLDASGQPWATVIEGEVGFVTSPTPRRLSIAAMLPLDDPAAEGIRDGAPIGAIGLEFATRRRNRVNGIMSMSQGGQGFTIDVVQSFGNCPQYIQTRKFAGARRSPSDGHPPVRSPGLTDAAMAVIRAADTFFIASRSATPGTARSEGLDMSHRDGRPGFVVVSSPTTLAFPDYRGNTFFNTFGNLQLDPRCGLLFIDFATGTTVQLAGRGRVVFDPDFCSQWPGAERAVIVEIDQSVCTEQRSEFSWEFLAYAPQLE